ncbi:MAG: DEAD/DEAH box helicase family protein [Nitrosomonadaceae bacterium]
MSFEDIDIPISVTTSTGNPIDDLFVPILKKSIKYDVAVGYFSTGWIRDAAEGIAAIAVNGGRARWIINPALSEEDWKLLSTVNSAHKKGMVNRIAEKDIERLIEELQADTRNTLSWLIADGVLTFRIAVPKNDLNGIFHAKIGVFTDVNGNKVAFSGSYNLTAAAETNWETIDVYSSRRSSEMDRISLKENEFNRMWENTDPNLETYMPDEEAIRPFIEFTKYNRRPYSLPSTGQDGVSEPAIPYYFMDENNKLRRHQEEALKQWFKNNGHGIFNMATGSGKTVTALVGITRLYELIRKKQSSLVVIITVPYRHLAEQWSEEAGAFGYKPIMCYSDYTDWPSLLGEALTDINQGITPLVVVITVNATYSSDKFQGFLDRISTNFLLIADEMHNLGAKKIKECLPDNAQFRMGLSATPIRKYDDTGSRLLEEYFGKQIIEYGIKEAIEDGTLTEYYYYPILVEFTVDEMGEYRELSIRIGKLFAQKKDEENPALKSLLIKRARLIGGAENKLLELRKLLYVNKESKYNLVYVGDNKVDDMKQVEAVLKMIGTDVGMKANKFTAEENMEARRKIMDEFRKGELQTIVAIRCLDEGVDLPRTEHAYILASTSNPRQFIQRRGRVLRKAEGKKYAYIYDFITVPPEHGSAAHDLGEADFSIERKLMGRELERVNEFATSAVNGGAALAKLRAIKKRLNLLDL